MGKPWNNTVVSRVPQGLKRDSFVEMLSTGQPCIDTGILHFVEQPDGSLWESYFDHSTSPIHNDLGAIVGLYSVLHETTELKLASRRRNFRESCLNKQQAPSSLAELFQGLRALFEAEHEDVPCFAGYFLDSDLPMEHAYSLSTSLGFKQAKLPTRVRLEDEADHRFGGSNSEDKYIHTKHTLEHYLRETLGTPFGVCLTDMSIISEICETRAWGVTSSAIWIYPIIAAGDSVPKALLIQGLNPRRPVSEIEHIAFSRTELNRRLDVLAKLSSVIITTPNEDIAPDSSLSAEELAASQHRFKLLVEASPSGIVIYDRNTEAFDFANKAYFDLTGVPQEKGVEAWHEYIAPESYQVAFDALTKDDKSLHNYALRWKRPWKTGIDRWTTCTATNHRFGSYNYILATFSDLSAARYAVHQESIKATEALRMKAEQLEFWDMIAHELRNPLGAILQSTDLLKEDLTSKPEATASLLHEHLDNVQTVIHCAQHMSRIIDDTLNLSMLDSGKLIITMVDADRNDIVLSSEIDASYTQLGIDWVMTDPSRFSQIVINLLANSLKFVKRSALRRVKVCLGASVTQPESAFLDGEKVDNIGADPGSTKASQVSSEVYLSVSISDTGPGMSAEQVSRLFQRYVQASEKTHIEYGGSGLGLYISRQLVVLLDGNIDVISEPGRGATFSFAIRTETCKPPSALGDPERLADSLESLQVPSKRRRILVVEDNLVNQKLLVKQLNRQGYKTAVANNGREAINAVLTDQEESNELDLVLCDVEMPVMGGVETVQEIRSLESCGVLRRRYPFIAVTANARQEQGAAMLDAGMDDIVSKPFVLKTLVDKIEALLFMRLLPTKILNEGTLLLGMKPI